MYHIPEKMNLKKFKNVHIPRRKDLFRKYGERFLNVGSIPDDAVVNMQPNRKIETMTAVHDELYRQYVREEEEKVRKAYEASFKSNPKNEEDV